jgi:hypothetical protein
LDVHGLKYLRAFEEILAPLAELPAHGNRRFFMDPYVSLLLLHFFNPVFSSLRSLQQATGLENVPKTLGVKRTSWGAMSESAGHVFDPEGLRSLLENVAGQVNRLPHSARLGDGGGIERAYRIFENRGVGRKDGPRASDDLPSLRRVLRPSFLRNKGACDPRSQPCRGVVSWFKGNPEQR